MARRNVTNPNQFKLFYGGQELQNTITESGDMFDHENLDQMWDRKAEEAKVPGNVRGHGAGVYDSLKSQGYNGMPLTVSHDRRGTYVYNGHHRIAAAAAIERETGKNVWIPVEHNDWDTQMNLRGEQLKMKERPPAAPAEPAPKKEIDALVDQVLK